MTDNLHGTMRPERNGNASAEDHLKEPRPVKWRTTDDGYEFIMRVCFAEGKKFIEKQREMWFPRGWEKKLDRLRAKHRKAGIPDANFWHPRKKKGA